MSPLGTAVIGLGVGRQHVAAYAELPESRLVAVCDQNPVRLAAAAEQYGVSTYTEVADLLRDDRVEVISVATPHPSHAPLAVAAVALQGGALGTIRMTTSSRVSRTRLTVHGSNGASVGVLEEPEGAVGYNDLWTIPGEEEIRDGSLARHVDRGEYIYRPQHSENRPTWFTGYAYKQAADPSFHAVQIQDFLRAILEQREPLVTGEEGRKSIALMTAIYESGRTGQPITLSRMG